MSVTSWQFAVLLAATLALVRLSPVAARKYVLIGASLVFYADASLVSLAIVLGLIGANFVALRAILQAPDDSTRDRIYLASIIGNLVVFITFKLVFEPAPAAAATSWALLGVSIGYPLGLSFIILMLHSAVTDAHSGRYRPKGKFSTFALFGLFFPYVSAGPIERLEHMEEALDRPVRPTVDDLREGLVLIGLGLVKKVVVASRLEPYVHRLFDVSGVYSAPTLLFAMVLNILYIYVDFSGYTDIARGAARCFGIHVSINFDRPMSSRSITEFWRRWHISFSSWLRDYIYMPLAFTLRGQGRAGMMAALLVTFVICGFWHRATWNFLVFGLLHGLAMICEMKLARQAPGADRPLARRLHDAAGHLYMFSFLTATVVLFSTDNLAQAGHIFARLVTEAHIPRPAEVLASRGPVLFILMLMGIGIWQLLDRWRRRLTPAMAPVFIAVCALILLFLGQPNGEGFVYAQF